MINNGTSGHHPLQKTATPAKTMEFFKNSEKIYFFLFTIEKICDRMSAVNLCHGLRLKIPEHLG